MLSIFIPKMSRSKSLVFALILQIFTTTTMTDKCETYNSYNSLALIYNNKGLCGGVLVHPSWVMLGYCCAKSRLDLTDHKCTRIRNVYRPFEVRKVVDIEPCTNKCGIVMMRVGKPFSTGYVFNIIKLPDRDEELPCPKIVYAYLAFKQPWQENSLSTYCGDITIRDRNDCWNKCDECVKEKKICGSYYPVNTKSYVNVCDVKNHTAGALFCKDKVVGFLDWSSCGKFGNKALAFYNVAKNVDFIKDTINSGKRSEKMVDGKSSDGARRSRICNWILMVFAVMVAMFVPRWVFF